MRRFLVLAVVLGVMVSVAGPAVAAERDPDGGQVPFYARIEPGDALSDGDLTLVYFYRPPACVPGDFNLLQFFDAPRVFGCQPATTEGHAIWEDGVFVGPAPFFSKLKGLGAVPVWLVDTSEYQAAVSDNMLTIGELESLSSLQRGTASHFNEVLRPSEASNIPMLIVEMKGQLEDGTPFRAHFVSIGPRTVTGDITLG